MVGSDAPKELQVTTYPHPPSERSLVLNKQVKRDESMLGSTIAEGQGRRSFTGGTEAVEVPCLAGIPGEAGAKG